MTAKLILAAGALLASAPAWAQSGSPEQSADDLVCQLSGDCGGAEQIAATQDKPVSRGFKIARKVALNDPSSAARPSIATTTRVKTKAEATRSSVAVAKPGRNRAIPVSLKRSNPGRADLRVTFVTGSAELTGAGRREADKFLIALSAPSLTGKMFRIEGHTDAVGTRAANLDLSKRRAQAVVEYLASKGAPSSQFNVVGYGFDKPLAGLGANASANRRVEIVLTK